LNDVLAFQLAVIGIVIFYFGIITAPIALFVAIRHWKTPGSLVHGASKWRFIAAILLASLQIIGWAVGIGYLLTR
jgi:hypothetical protein